MLTRFLFAIGLILLYMLAMGDTIEAQIDKQPEVQAKIQGYLQSLDSPNYQERESGLQGLSTMGLPAARPLAEQILAGTPESSWRSKIALEAIGIQGTEDTFLKTASILKLLHMGANETLMERISELELHWQFEQKKSIISQLQSVGARVSEGANAANLLGINGNAMAWDLFEGQVVLESSLGQPTNRLASTAKEPMAQQSVPETLLEVDRILAATREDNRARLFGNQDRGLSASAPNNPRVEIDAEILRELQIQRRFGLARQGVFLGNRPHLHDGITITFDQQWRGKVTDLHRLHNLQELRRIEIDQIDLPEDQVKELADLSVASIQVVGDQLDSQRLQLLTQNLNLQDLEIFDRKLKSQDLKSFGQIPMLLGIIFRGVTLAPAALDELSTCRRLTSVAFIEMDIAPPVMASLAKVPNLRLVNMELCKFEISAYRMLKKNRPDVEIGFTPKALLGVRGPMNPTSSGCEISQVVPNSGAEVGGLRAGDVVAKINGQPVEFFEELRLHVAQFQAGDELRVTVLREGEELELKVQLSPFEANE